MPISDRPQPSTPAVRAGYARFFIDAAGEPHFLDDSGAVINFTGPAGPTGPTGEGGALPTGTFNTIVTPVGGPVVGDLSEDTLALVAGAGVSVTGSAAVDSVTLANIDRGTTSFATHEGLGDPHPQYTTSAEAAAAAPVQSVTAGDGASVSPTTGAVVVSTADGGAAAFAAHEAAGDPHPQYTTTAEAAAAAPVQSVTAGAGVTVSPTTGTTQVANADGGAAEFAAHEAAADPHPQYLTVAEGDARYTTSFPTNHSAAFEGAPTALTGTTDRDLMTITIPASAATVGLTIRWMILSNQANGTLAATNEAYVKVNGTKRFIDTRGTGTASASNRGHLIEGMLTFKSTGAAAILVGNNRISYNGVQPAESAGSDTTTVNTDAIVTLVFGLRYSATATGSTTTPQVGMAWSEKR